MGQTASQSAAPAAASCPIKHDAPIPKASCPIDHESTKPTAAPMPHRPLWCESAQPDALPTTSPCTQSDRRPPHNPCGILHTRDTSVRWEYPSPQQFYNALVRKGWETPEEHVETMVEIHNFLNEQAWLEVLKWEKRQYPADDVQLARLRGRPGEMSPKARFWMFAGWLLPSRFNAEPPFDRHDWVVRRPQTGEEVRYVIDYYSAPPEPDGSPVFSLDVRPALDSFGSLKDRIAVATQDAWTNFREAKTPPV
ncbi:cytochrome c/c1 heme-lyase [Infundibulicybe gibba]|nr:cytochrome c/c1 heme-lyase [Infundibulicybe gibba]